MENQEQAKGKLSSMWKKASDLGKGAAEKAKSMVEQTKDSIHEKRAERYAPVTQEEFAAKTFLLPSVIFVEDDGANSEFIEVADAVGWSELHKDTQVLHLYASAAEKSDLLFIPTVQKNIAYCQDKFEPKKYVDATQVFAKATVEKLAELNNIAFCLGAKSCSVEIVEAESDRLSVKSNASVGKTGVSLSSAMGSAQKQSGKNISYFEGSDTPTVPPLKWFTHDEAIKGLIEMRMKKAIRSNLLELRGSASATMAKATACVVDKLLNIGGKFSMEKEAVKEHNSTLLFEVEF